MSEPRPSSKNLQRAAGAVVLIVLAIIAMVFIGENLTHSKEKQQEQATPTSLAGSQPTMPTPKSSQPAPSRPASAQP